MGNSSTSPFPQEKPPSGVAAAAASRAGSSVAEISALSPPAAVRWRVWPLWDTPFKGVAVLASLAIAGFVAEWATGQPYLGLIVAAALTASLWRFFVPVVFELGPGGVSRQCFGRKYRIPWKSIGRCEICKEGVLLLPRADACPLDVFRGLFLAWGDDEDGILANVEFYLGQRAEGRGQI